MARIPLVGPTSNQSLAAAASVCYNLYPEAIEDPDDRSKNIGILKGVPGNHLFSTLTHAEVRGMWSGGGRLFVVSGGYLFEIASDGSIVSTNALSNDDGLGLPAQLFGNGQQLGVVAGGQFYYDNGAGPIAARFLLEGLFTTVDGVNLVWSSGAVFTADCAGRTGTFNGSPSPVTAFTDSHHITISVNVGVQATPVAFSVDGGDLVTAVTGTCLDGSAYVQRPSGGSPDLGRQVNFSDVNDMSVWRGLSFFTKEGNPDYIQSILADREQLYIFGTEESEVWQSDPNTGLPVRIPGAAAREGSVARWAPVSLAQSVFFLGGSPRGETIAYQLRGFVPVRISTHAVEVAWGAFASAAAEATAYPYINGDGHQWWVINFNEPVDTWVYDVTASQQLGYPIWFQRAQWDTSLMVPAFGKFPFWFHTFIPEWGNGKHIVGDADSGELHEMSDLFFDDNGADLAYLRAIPYRYNGTKRMFFGRQDLEMQTGTAKALTVTAATAANPPVLTSVAHGLSSKQTLAFSGATGKWRPLNGVNYIITVLSADTFSIAGLNATGFGALTGTVVYNPIVRRRYSDDRGQTFINPQYAPIGAHGNYSNKVFWPTGGSSCGRVWEYFVIGQYQIALIDLQAEETAGIV